MFMSKVNIIKNNLSCYKGTVLISDTAKTENGLCIKMINKYCFRTKRLIDVVFRCIQSERSPGKGLQS